MCTEYFEGIVDSTLREGEQAPGVGFGLQQKLNIIDGLNDLGVEEMELGVAAQSTPELKELTAAARQRVGNTCSLALWSRCREEDIVFAAACGPDVLSLSMPVSDIHLVHKLGRDRSWALATLEQSIHLARDLGVAAVSVGLEDATRADRTFLARVVAVAERAGAWRVRLADTVGIATPGMITKLVRRIRQQCRLPVGLHAHNDFGMATANSVAALEAGAAWVDATVLGLGERAGNCRLEELAGYLSLVADRDRYRPELLPALCQLVAGSAGLSIAETHPVVGEKVFTCETGLHVHGLTVNPATYEPFDPGRLGRRRTIRFGGKTGKRAVRNSLAAMGVSITDREAAILVARLREIAGKGGGALDDTGLVRLAGTLEDTAWFVSPEGMAAAGMGTEPV